MPPQPVVGGGRGPVFAADPDAGYGGEANHGWPAASWRGAKPAGPRPDLSERGPAFAIRDFWYSPRGLGRRGLLEFLRLIPHTRGCSAWSKAAEGNSGNGTGRPAGVLPTVRRRGPADLLLGLLDALEGGLADRVGGDGRAGDAVDQG